MPQKKRILRCTKIEKRRGAGFRKPPQERRGACRSRVSDDVISFVIRLQASAEAEDLWGAGADKGYDPVAVGYRASAVYFDSGGE